MLIPRKDNGVRIFTQIDDRVVDQLKAASTNTPSSDQLDSKLMKFMQAHVDEVLYPYTMVITGVLWQSHYRVAQRLLDKFRDARGRVFILGDACHTHSPKAGQGLNISMQDAYNLTWKLALVLKRLAREDLLATYELERRHIAQQLIDFDVQFAGAFAGAGQADAAVMHRLWAQHHGFTSGLQHAYPESIIVRPVTKSMARVVHQSGEAVEPLTPGKRLLPIKGLVRCLDGNVVDLLDEMPSNGRFHIILFAPWSHDPPATVGVLLRLVLAPFKREATKDFAPENISHANAPASNAQYLVDLFIICGEQPLSCRCKLGSLCEMFPGRMYEHSRSERRRSFHEDVGVGDEGGLVLVRPDGYISVVAGCNEQGVVVLRKGLDKVLLTPDYCRK